MLTGAEWHPGIIFCISLSPPAVIGSESLKVVRNGFCHCDKTFQAALDAINAMGAIAERENHHPDFHLASYREVRVDIYTHSVKGVTENDITLAELFMQEVKIVYSPKWLKEHPEAQQST